MNAPAVMPADAPAVAPSSPLQPVPPGQGGPDDSGFASALEAARESTGPPGRAEGPPQKVAHARSARTAAAEGAEADGDSVGPGEAAVSILAAIAADEVGPVAREAAREGDRPAQAATGDAPLAFVRQTAVQTQAAVPAAVPAALPAPTTTPDPQPGPVGGTGAGTGAAADTQVTAVAATGSPAPPPGEQPAVTVGAPSDEQPAAPAGSGTSGTSGAAHAVPPLAATPLPAAQGEGDGAVTTDPQAGQGQQVQQGGATSPATGTQALQTGTSMPVAAPAAPTRPEGPAAPSVELSGTPGFDGNSTAEPIRITHRGLETQVGDGRPAGGPLPTAELHTLGTQASSAPVTMSPTAAPDAPVTAPGAGGGDAQPAGGLPPSGARAGHAGGDGSGSQDRGRHDGGPGQAVAATVQRSAQHAPDEPVHAGGAAPAGAVPAEPRPAAPVTQPATTQAAAAAAQAPQQSQGLSFVAPAAEPGRPDGTRLHELVEHVKAQLRVASRGGETSARIVLHPPELGEIQVKLSYKGGGVSAVLTTDSGTAAAVLAQASADLRRSLESQGLTVLGLDIGQKGHEHRPGLPSWAPAHGARRVHGLDGADDEGGELAAVTPTVSTNTKGEQVDLLA